jgi:hypothetical protein
VSLRRLAELALVALARLSVAIGSGRADHCRDHIRLEVGGSYEWAGRTNVTVRRMNLSPRRLTLLMSAGVHLLKGPFGIATFVHGPSDTLAVYIRRVPPKNQDNIVPRTWSGPTSGSSRLVART